MLPLIELRQVEKHYQGRKALSVDDFTLVEGDRVVLHGRNGSGKSTLLRLLGRISSPEAGSIRFATQLRNKFPGYVPQIGGLVGSLTLQANIELRALLFGQQVGRSELIDELGLAPYQRKSYGQLSVGYQRLAAVAAALVFMPDWLLLDEPFGWLDNANRGILIQVLERVVAQIPLVVIALPERPSKEDLPFMTRYVQVLDGCLCEQA